MAQINRDDISNAVKKAIDVKRYKLEDGTVRHLSGRPGQVTVVDGPFPETKEVVGGYFLLAADSYDEAVALASTCPHLDFGRIEVRRIEPTM